MSTIWDRTIEVIRGRGAMLATIAALLSFLPKVIQGVVLARTVGAVSGPFTPFAAPGATPTAAVGVFGLLVGLCAVLSNLSLVAAASSPSVQSAGSAMGIGVQRLPATIGLTLLLILAGIVLFIPVGFIIGASGIGLFALSHGSFTPGAGFGSAILLVIVYFLVVAVLLLWVAARLFLLVPVIVNERLGAGAFARSFALTRGLVWRLIGIFLLFLIVAAVAGGAAQAVLGLVARLMAGSSAPGAVLIAGQTGAAAVGAAFAVVIATFSAQLYRATTGREAAETFA